MRGRQCSKKFWTSVSDSGHSNRPPARRSANPNPKKFSKNLDRFYSCFPIFSSRPFTLEKNSLKDCDKLSSSSTGIASDFSDSAELDHEYVAPSIQKGSNGEVF
jgi:hypothetical protein